VIRDSHTNKDRDNERKKILEMLKLEYYFNI
jgi:hypothetical protein